MSPTSSVRATGQGLVADVEVVLRDGTLLAGAIDNFNTRAPGIFLRIAGDGKPSIRELLFDHVRWVAFKNRPGGSRANLQPTDRVIQVRFEDGSTLRGVTLTAPGGRAGFFVLPSDRDDVDRTFVPVGAVREVISLERLGDILEREGMASAETVRAALKRQDEVRGEKVGSILVRQGRLAEEHLSQGLELQESAQTGRRLGEILLQRGFISEEDLAEALGVQAEQRGRRLGEVMVEMGLATKKMIAIALAIQYSVPFVDLAAQSLDPRLEVLVPEETAWKHRCLPLSVQQGVLTLAVPDPTDLAGRDAVRKATGLTTVIAVAAEPDIARAIGRYYRPRG